MKRIGAVFAGLGLACVGCSESGSSSDCAAAPVELTGCEVGSSLAGAAYDITKSRFAFGSTPTESDANGSMRWVGVDGVVVIEENGGEVGSLNAGASEATLP